MPIGKIYASDLVGASVGCLTVLAGMSLLDVPSLILVFAAIGAGAAFLFAGRDTTTSAGRRAGIALASLLILAALNGIFGVLCSALAVFISIHLGISTNLFIGAACYALLLPCVRGMIRARTRIPGFHDTAQDVSAA